MILTLLLARRSRRQADVNISVGLPLDLGSTGFILMHDRVAQLVLVKIRVLLLDLFHQYCPQSGRLPRLLPLNISAREPIIF